LFAAIDVGKGGLWRGSKGTREKLEKRSPPCRRGREGKEGEVSNLGKSRKKKSREGMSHTEKGGRKKKNDACWEEKLTQRPNEKHDVRRPSVTLKGATDKALRRRISKGSLPPR